MGLYREQVVPRLVDLCCGLKANDALRQRVCEGLAGEVVELGFGSLPLPDASQDAALSTWTLCTVPDVRGALRELRRVLRPGGSLHLVEHGLAPDRAVQRWQHRLEPVQEVVAGGCHLTRPVVGMLEDAGFVVVERDDFYEKGAPKSLGALTLGRAVSP